MGRGVRALVGGHMVRRFSALIAMLVMSLTACSDSERDSGDLQASWNAATAANQELQGTLERLYRSCMEEQGFDVHPEDLGYWEATHYATDYFDDQHQRMFPDKDAAQSAGFAASPEEQIEQALNPAEGDRPVPVVGDAAESPFDMLPYAERSAYNAALLGWSYAEAELGGDDRPFEETVVLPNGYEVHFPIEGCKSEVHEQVFDGEVARFFELQAYVLDGWAIYLDQQVWADESMIEAESQWLACMTLGGYDQLDELRNIVEVARAIWSKDAYEGELSGQEWDEMKQREIELALVHLDCVEESEVDVVLTELVERYSDQYLHEQETEFYAWEKFVAEAEARAQDLL